MSRTAVRIGPEDQGRHMTLEEFNTADAQPGHLYELGRGVITVVHVPDRRHLAQVDAAREQLSAYRRSHPGRIFSVAHGGECKILLAGAESERHPDLAIYKAPPTDDEDVWATWIPEIVIEVVSPGSEQRDYVEKREEYLQFGVLEYWVIDAGRQEMLALRRSGGRWAERIVRSGEIYQTPQLPDFEFALAPIFDAARAAS
jgi:Uma2 family endonuclease